MFFDSHCHIDFPVFDHDRDEVLARFAEIGGRGIIIPGMSESQWSTASRLKQLSSLPLYSAVGLHPYCLTGSELSGVNNCLYDGIQRVDPVAVGECGLDRVATKVPLDVQLRVLESHLQVASESQLPIILHCRKAHNELLTLLNRFPKVRGVLHGFSGSAALANEYLRRDFKLGIGGVISYPRAQKTRATIAQLSLNDVVLETDAPDMPLEGAQGQRNTPQALSSVAEHLAALMELEQANLQRHIFNETLTWFGINL